MSENFKDRILKKVKDRQKELSEKMEKIRFNTDEQSLSSFQLYSHRKNEVDRIIGLIEIEPMHELKNTDKITNIRDVTIFDNRH